MLLLDGRAWLFSAKAYVAAIAALFLGLAMNLPRPYWAMATVYIVLQPQLGPTRAKGIYRIIGTSVGGLFSILLLPVVVEQPLLMSAVISLWLSACVFLALRQRGPRSYLFMLSGYTVTFVCFPAQLEPESIFPVASARCQEIMLGSIVAVVVAAIVFPSSIRPQVLGQVERWMRDAARWCRQIVDAPRRSDSQRQRLAVDIHQFAQLIEVFAHDDPRHATSGRTLRQLRAHMLQLLLGISSIGNRLTALRAHDPAMPPGLPELLQRMLVWMEDGHGHDDSEYHCLCALIAAMKPDPDDSATRLYDGLLLRMQMLVELWQDCRGLRHALQARTPAPPAHARVDADAADIEHHDLLMAGFSAASAGLTLFCYCAMWIALGWSTGTSGAMMGAMAASIFAAQDDPVPSMMAFLAGLLGSIVLAGVYLFGVLPAVHDFGMLVLVLAPTFLLLGLTLTRPAMTVVGMPLLFTLATNLSLQNSEPVRFDDFANASISTVIGIVFAIVMTRLFRSVGTEWSSRRLLRQGWQTLAAAAEGHGIADRDRFGARMLDLLGQLVPRLAATRPDSHLASVDMLNEIRTGQNILLLRQARHDLPAPYSEHLDQALGAIAAHYRAQADARHPLDWPAPMRERLDSLLQGIDRVPAGDGRDAALIGLLGLRHGFFPQQQLADTAAPVATR